MYKGKRTNRERQRRYREKQKGVTGGVTGVTEGVTPLLRPIIPVIPTSSVRPYSKALQVRVLKSKEEAFTETFTKKEVLAKLRKQYGVKLT